MLHYVQNCSVQSRSVQSAVDKGMCRAYRLFVLVEGVLGMVAYFQLQPAESDLQQLAEQYWEKTGERERELEKAAFEAGEAIRGGDYSLANLEAIVRWKSERVVHYLIGNSNEKIKSALAVAALPDAKTGDAVKASIFPWPRRFWRQYTRSGIRCWIFAPWKRWGTRGTMSGSMRNILPSASGWPKAKS
jgi:hypothetical protein